MLILLFINDPSQRYFLIASGDLWCARPEGEIKDLVFEKVLYMGTFYSDCDSAKFLHPSIKWLRWEPPKLAPPYALQE